MALAVLLMTGTALAEQATATDLATATELAQTEEPLARDITAECLINGQDQNQHLNQVRDGNYRTFLEVPTTSGVCALEITPPAGAAAGGILIKWRSDPVATAIQVRNDQDEWVNVAACEAEFNAQYIALPDVTQTFRIIGRDNQALKLQICEVTVVTPGRLPEDFQVWQKPTPPVDLMVLSGHPDDEMLWFGGMIPYYAMARDKQVLVVCATFCVYNRRLELLDCLWTCGVRVYPVFARLEDVLTQDVNTIFNTWGRQRAYNLVAQLYRQYRPSVVALQDEKGEYGHGVHRAFSLAGRMAVDIAADPNALADTQEQYPPYEVPKVYVHLWKENQIQMDWHQPLEALGGLTAYEVAEKGFACHVSQIGPGKRWDMEEALGGQWDNSLFGLFHTTVGPDVLGGDLFENIVDEGE